MSEQEGHIHDENCNHEEHVHDENCKHELPEEIVTIIEKYYDSVRFCCDAILDGADDGDKLEADLIEKFKFEAEICGDIIGTTAETINLFSEEDEKVFQIDTLITHLVEEMGFDEEVSIASAFVIHERIGEIIDEEEAAEEAQT